MPRQAQCPASYTHAYHENTRALYWKVASTLNTKGVLCLECKAVYLLTDKGYDVYPLDPTKSIPLRRSRVEADKPA